MSLDPHVVVCVSSRPLISDLPSFDHPLLSSLPLSCPFVILWGYIVVVVSCYFLLLCPAKVSFFMCQTERLLCFVRCFSCCLCDFLQRVNSLYSSHCISKMLKRHTHRFQETQWVLNPILVSNVSLTLVVVSRELTCSLVQNDILPPSSLFSSLFSLLSSLKREENYPDSFPSRDFFTTKTWNPDADPNLASHPRLPSLLSFPSGNRDTHMNWLFSSEKREEKQNRCSDTITILVEQLNPNENECQERSNRE